MTANESSREQMVLFYDSWARRAEREKKNFAAAVEMASKMELTMLPGFLNSQSGEDIMELDG